MLTKLFGLGFPKKKSVDLIPKKCDTFQNNDSFIEDYDENDIKQAVEENENFLKRTCSTNQQIPMIQRTKTIELQEKMKSDLSDSENEENEMPFDIFVGTKQYLQVIMHNENIHSESKEEISDIIRDCFSNESTMFQPALYLESRSIIRCIMNTCYLNKSFINQQLFEILFDQLEKQVVQPYDSIIREFRKYHHDTWSGPKATITNWNIFNSDIVANNISEAFNADIYRGVAKTGSMSLPAFIYMVKLVFKKNQQNILLFNDGKLAPQRSRHTEFKNAMISVLNMFLFDEEIDVVTYLSLIDKVNKIKTLEDRKEVLKLILSKRNSSEMLCRQLFLLEHNYKLNENHKKQMKEFEKWTKEQIENKSRVGLVLERLKKEVESSEQSNEMECDEKNEEERHESSNSSSSNSEENRSSSYNSSDSTSYDSDEMDEDVEEMIGKEDALITDILNIFQSKTENSQKRNFEVETTEDEVGVKAYEAQMNIDQLEGMMANSSLKTREVGEKQNQHINRQRTIPLNPIQQNNKYN